MHSSPLRLIWSILLLVACLAASGQNRISVKEENFDDMETTAMVNPEKDRNNRDCALVIFHNVEPDGYYFDSGSVFIKAENHLSRDNGEKTIFLYISEGAKVITIRHRSDGIVSLRYEFVNGPLQARHTYHVYLGHVEPVNSAARQYLTFEIDPPAASLEVEENPDREPGVFTPWVLDAAGRASKLLGLGDYRYTVSAPDCHPSAGVALMRDPNDATVERVRLKSSFGTLTLAGKDLDGATVFVDGRNAGSAGLSGYRLAPGEHTVKITRPMYKLFTKTFTVSEGEDTRLEISLVPNFTSVELKCADSAADLFVREGGRDRLLGTGSAREPLEQGDYLIVAKRTGHREATRRITVAAGGATSFTVDAPVPMYGSINIVSVPSPAKIELDGKPSGATPRMLNNVLVGSHRVKVYADGYVACETTVNVTEGAMAEVKAELKAADKTPDVDISTIGNGYNPPAGSEVRTGKLANGLTYYIY
ncbi:MAG: PEGA domain-containing protein, partial [Muribaculaceae bacterium]|nr:PEGA domain-containing protein [Muribaculaceae bacterium]